ncbi:hypothetical protein MAR_013901 [Mya arenaria]|uniref:Uncharacterized protein n=1 Tax=Mya arenaria TaxID=6604 RepID=A0ABY7G4F1_MYAAR|nr:hypothetical protein MAR_013901 [Mya arenaria]
MLFKYTLVLLVCVILIDPSDAWLWGKRNKKKIKIRGKDVDITITETSRGMAAKPEKKLDCKDIEGCGKIADGTAGAGKLWNCRHRDCRRNCRHERCSCSCWDVRHFKSTNTMNNV